jgi:hypothetical protein
MIDLKIASLRSHGNNISRYRRLLRTNLSDLEREFIERRLNEEKMAMEGLPNFPVRALFAKTTNRLSVA